MGEGKLFSRPIMRVLENVVSFFSVGESQRKQLFSYRYTVDLKTTFITQKNETAAVSI